MVALFETVASRKISGRAVWVALIQPLGMDTGGMDLTFARRRQLRMLESDRWIWWAENLKVKDPILDGYHREVGVVFFLR